MDQQEQPDPAPEKLSKPAGEPSPGSLRVEVAIDRWQRELLDLSRNNRLLYFQAGQGRRGQGGVPIAQPLPPELFDRLANREKRQTIAHPPAQPALTLELAPFAEEALTPQPPPPAAGERETNGRPPSSTQEDAATR